MNTSLSIKDKILHGLELKSLQGIEIGPLTKPFVTKDEGNVRYVDRATTEEIKKWYSKNEAVDLEKIVDIDYVWGKQTLSQAIGEDVKFDYCIASHVIEHVPDLIGWLQEISEILCDYGVASFSVPDKRYTFDFLRPETVTADLIDAYHRQLKKPSLRHIYDHFSNYTEIDIAEAWSDDFDGSNLKPVNDPARINKVCEDALKNDKYVDSHCWVFTPQSFFHLLDSLSQIGLLNFRVKRFFDVEYHNFEFVVQLEKLPESLAKEEKRRLFVESLEKTRDHVLRIQFLSLPAGEAQVYYDTGAGFNELNTSSKRYGFTFGTSELAFRLPPVPLKNLRFDPVRSQALFTITSMELLLFGTNRHVIPLETLQPGQHLKASKLFNGVFLALSRMKIKDPYVVIELPPEIQEIS